MPKPYLLTRPSGLLQRPKLWRLPKRSLVVGWPMSRNCLSLKRPRLGRFNIRLPPASFLSPAARPRARYLRSSRSNPAPRVNAHGIRGGQSELMARKTVAGSSHNVGEGACPS